MRFRSAFRVLTAFLTLLAFITNVGAQPPASAQPGAPTAPIVRAIDIQYAGPESVSREKILANIRTRVGKPYSQQAVEDDIRSLYATGNVENVRMFGEPVSDGVKVVIVVAGKGTINAVELRGVTRFKRATRSARPHSRPIARRSSNTTPARASPIPT
jgi:outer membrane protein insertion porin family